MLPRKTRNYNDRATVRDWNRVVSTVRRQCPLSATPGLNVTPEVGGAVIRYLDPARTRWVFVIAFDGDVILCKEAVSTNAGWKLGQENEDIIRAAMGPNYTREHFERFLISGEQQPGPTDQACLLLAGHVVPHYRLKLVEPPDPADCAECS